MRMKKKLGSSSTLSPARVSNIPMLEFRTLFRRNYYAFHIFWVVHSRKFTDVFNLVCVNVHAILLRFYACWVKSEIWCELVDARLAMILFYSQAIANNWASATTTLRWKILSRDKYAGLKLPAENGINFMYVLKCVGLAWGIAFIRIRIYNWIMEALDFSMVRCAWAFRNWFLFRVTL